MSGLVRLGGSDVEIPALALGTWSWGDERYWDPYSPLGQGILAGAYDTGEGPTGARSTEPWFSAQALISARPLVARLQGIGERYGVGASAVALRWLIERGVVPIAGARRGDHARANVSALGFSLEPAEVSLLEVESRPFVRA